MTEEVRVTSSTGGAKGSKPQRMALIPSEALLKLSEIYAMGANKYSDINYRRGYPWHLSADALLRHFHEWNRGVDLDDESGLPHILHVAWHCLTLYMFSLEHPDFDDRFPAAWAKDQEEVEASRKLKEETEIEANKNFETVLDTLRPILKTKFNYSTDPATNPNIAYATSFYNEFISGGPYNKSDHYPTIELKDI